MTDECCEVNDVRLTDKCPAFMYLEKQCPIRQKGVTEATLHACPDRGCWVRRKMLKEKK